VETAGSTHHYCSPDLCYNNTTNTPTNSLETMPKSQKNNGTVTKSGCKGNIYLFSGKAMQCTEFDWGNCCASKKFAFGYGTCNAGEQTLAQALVHDGNATTGGSGIAKFTSYSGVVPIYDGSSGMNYGVPGEAATSSTPAVPASATNGADINQCSQSAIDSNAGCGEVGDTIFIGDYCSLKLPVFGTCLAHSYVFCKFNGLLATLIQAQGRAQLAGGPNKISWGTAKSPNCTGFTPAQFQMLNFSNMNLSEYVNVMEQQVTNMLSSGALSTQITNTTASVTSEVTQIEGSTSGTQP
jgi:conjugal transfer mating pair stabilization protein TraN